MYIPLWLIVLCYLFYCWQEDRPTQQERIEQRALDREWHIHCRKDRKYKKANNLSDARLLPRIPEIIFYSIVLVVSIYAVVYWNILK